MKHRGDMRRLAVFILSLGIATALSACSDDDTTTSTATTSSSMKTAEAMGDLPDGLFAAPGDVVSGTVDPIASVAGPSEVVHIFASELVLRDAGAPDGPMFCGSRRHPARGRRGLPP